ncbi:MAG: transporter substrate-binding domain-containing protein [Synergistaceae bacterium]|nr:transporter substrate-binding domain-containing protein [Synergistaceae bacterium]
MHLLKKFVFLFFSLLICVECFAREPITSISQLNDSNFTIAASETGPFADAVKRDLPKAKIIYLDGHPAHEAVKMEKVDAYASNRTGMEIAIAAGLKGVKILPGNIGDKNEIVVGISRASKIPGLKEKINQFLSEIKASGTFQEMYQRWIIDRNFTMPDIEMPSSELKIKIGTVGLMVPFNFYVENKLTGLDIELGRRLAAWLGAEVEFQVYDFGGLIAAAATGKIDCIMADLVITPERAEKIDFSDALFYEETALMVKDEGDASEIPPSIKKFDGKRIGVLTETIHYEVIKESLPSAELFYFDSMANLISALDTGKIDAGVHDDASVLEIERANPSLKRVKGVLRPLDNAYVFAKNSRGDKIRSELNEFLRSLKSDGTLEKISDVWFGNDESLKTLPDYENYPATNGILKIALDSETPPFTYLKNGKIVGYEIDIIVRFCKAQGYRPEFSEMNFSAIIPSIVSGKCDIGIGSISITPERKESVNFSEPNYTGGSVLFTLTKSETKPKFSGRYSTFEDLAEKKIGVQTGTLSTTLVAEKLPNAKIEYFDALSDILIALKTKKVDALACTIFAARDMMNNNDDVIFLDQWLRTSDLSPIFTKSDKGKKICEEYGEFMKSLWDNGTMKNLEAIWLGKDDSKKIIKDYSNLPAPNGVLKMAVDTSWPPLAYVKDNKVVGYDIDLAVRFCEAHGYGLEVLPMSVSGFVAAIQSGKCDFSQSINFTEERAEVTLFPSTPSAHAGNVIVVLKDENPQSASFQELAGKRIGVQTGTTHPLIAQQFAPAAILEYFENQTDVFTALKAGKVDAICTSDLTARYVETIDDSFVMFGDKLTASEQAPIFPKTEAGEKLCAQFSEFNKKMWEDGTINKLEAIWYGKDESKRVVKDYSNLPAPNGVLKMATDLSLVPFAYMKDNKIVGYDVDCAIRFCEAYGYGLEIVPMSFAAIIPALQSGKCDFAACIVTYTPERAEKVLYAYPNIKSGVAFYVRKSENESAAVVTESTNTPSFIEELKASFERTFLREDRYKLFIEGIIHTLIITALSIILGTILGFVVYLSCRTGSVIANLTTKFFVWLIRGMPMVVLLMILYYIVFGKVDIAGIWVAIIAFTLTFGSGVYGMLVAGVKAIDPGQLEAAYALGFTDWRAFFTIILPQAALHFMPTYKGEVVALIKATAIVGYIAVQDLTKMGDIVRSRTYEAFFPLIAVAVIYFVLAGMLNIFVNVIHNRIRPEKRTKSDILRGIEIHD